MEKMNIFFLIIIILYLVFSFIKTKKTKIIKSEKFKDIKKDNENYDNFVITAVLATMMGEKPFIVKRVFLIGTVDEKKSFWKISGRNSSMMKKI